ncbi:MAG: hypothetical protein NWE89_05155 [Candidatus Bathyarchaeota archaeon]|nr:hypothetical protein [Candidatus Bathyarchaeota archaeon]
MGFDKGKGQMVGIYTALIGVLYTVLGVIEIFGWLGVEILPRLAGLFFVVNDAFNGFVLLVIGLVYLKGVGSVMSGEREGLSYVSVGALMSTVLLTLYVANIISNGLGLVLGFEDWLGWTVWDDFRPGLILWVLAIPAVLVALKKEWRE